MRLLEHYLKNELGTLLKHDIRLRAIGRLDEMEGAGPASAAGDSRPDN